MSEPTGGVGARVNGGVPRALGSHLRRAVGPDALNSILAEAEFDIDPDDEAIDREWVPIADVDRFVAAAERWTGDPDLGRRTGEEMFRFRPDLHAFYHGAGSVAEAVKLAVNLGTRTRTKRALVVAEEGECHLVVRSRATSATWFGCGVSVGHWSLIPSLFGTTGAATKTACVSRGDPRCEIRVAWDPVDAPDDSDTARSRSRRESMVSRFEELLGLAAELTAEKSTESLLDKIAERAVAAILAPSAVVAVRLSEGDPLVLGWEGISQPKALELAHALDMSNFEPEESMSVVPIESGRRHYGHLLVIGQAGAPLSRSDHRMVRAYAGHATAAIEAAAALETARVERDTAESLLGLARALAELGSTEEIAQRIAEAAPSVIKCDLAATLLYDPAMRTLRFAGSWPHPSDTLGIDTVSVDDIAGAGVVLEELQPVHARTSDTDGMLRSLLRAAGVSAIAAAPIVIRGDAAGVVLAGTTELPSEPDVAQMLHRLSGLGDHAASALDNSRLLERVRHQAMHDGLTGLPNRTLIEDRVEHALTVAERLDRWVTLLFIDLDRFKEVNDELGHAAGDALLRQLAARLTSCVRASDTVGRLGGDEFLILLENTCGDEDGARVADKVIEALRAPFAVGDREATVSVSIGITSAPGRGTAYDDLLARADQAMYEVKRRGRDGWSVFSATGPGLGRLLGGGDAPVA